MALGNDTVLGFKITADADQAKREVADLRGTVHREIAAVTGTGGFGGIAPVAAVATAAIAAITAGAITLGTTLFNLTKDTSDAGSEIHDFSERMAVSAERTSALKFAIDQTDSSLGEFAAGVTRLKKTIAEFNQGSDEAREKLTRLGLDTKKPITDLDAALVHVFKVIHDAKPGIDQTAAATDAFGKSGDKLIGIVNQAEGDLRKLQKTADELGITFSKADADAADQFGDQLKVLEAQVKAIGYAIGKQVGPEIGRTIQDISKWLKENKDEWPKWGATVRGVMGDAISATRGLLGWLDTVSTRLQFIISLHNKVNTTFAAIGGSNRVEEIRPGVGVDSRGNLVRQPGRTVAGADQSVFEAAQRLAEAARTASARPYGTTGPGGGKGGGGGGADRSAQDAQRREIDQLQAFNREVESVARTNTEILKREYERRLISLEAYYEQAQTDSAAHFLKQQQALNREEEIAKKYTKNAEDLALKLREIKLRRDEADDQRSKERVALDDQRQDALEKAKLEHAEATLRLRETLRDAEREQVKRHVDLNVLAESDGIARLMEIDRAGHEERRKILLAYVEIAGQNEQARQEALDDLAQHDAEYTLAFEANTERRLAAMLRETEGRTGGPLTPPGLRRPDFIDFGNPVPEEDAERLFGKPPPFDKWAEAFDILKESGMHAFRSLSQGFGSMVTGFLLGEKLTLKSFLAIAKGAAANLAGQAVGEALMQLAHAAKEYALGLAAAANPFTAALAPGHFLAASAHLTAAAAYGVVAAGAGAAALLIPGGGQSAGAGGYSGGSASAGNTSYTPTVGQPVVEERGGSFAAFREALRQPLAVALQVDVTTQEGVMVKAWIKDVRLGGEARDVSLELIGAT